jgi:L-2-hydroxyglutarate oxidase LhgO
MNDADVLVVGAGVVGLAVARALTLAGRSVVVVESRGAFGEETSSRNSEVIHSGIYYPTDSLKARLCVRGRAMLYDFCEAHGVAHLRCGKLIVAAEESELAGLEALARKGTENGVEDLRMLSAGEARALEPALACVGALLAPSTGIVDSHGFMLALTGEAEGAVFAYRAPFLSARVAGDGFAAEIGGEEPVQLAVGALVNAAGLSASRVARAIEGLDPEFVPETLYAKGNYFALSGRAPFGRLIYPAPQAHGLGVHLTFDLGGQARFGPDVEWVETVEYNVDPERGQGFAEAIRRYWPGLPDGALTPAYTGIRPKIAGPTEPAADFRIDGPERHGVAGLVNLFGIESPGLTSSLAIAEEVAARL